MSIDPIDDYLRKLRRRWWWRRDRDRRLVEAEDHLRSAAEELEAQGYSPEEAADTAIVRFEKPHVPGRQTASRVPARLFAAASLCLVAAAVAGGVWAGRDHSAQASGAKHGRSLVAPHLLELSEAQAATTLERVDLRADVHFSCSGARAYVVLAQSPQPGQTVSRVERMSLVVSAGEENCGAFGGAFPLPLSKGHMWKVSSHGIAYA